MRRLEQVCTPYNDVDVIERVDGGIDLDVIGATHATWHPTERMTGHAWDAITAGTLCTLHEPRSILLLGLGGGTVLRQIRAFLPDVRMVAVEIDIEMVRLARTYMELDDLRVEVVEGDAYRYLEQNAEAFDVVIDDLYRCGDRDVERPRAVGAEAVRKLCRHLAPGGILVMNFVLGTGHTLMHRAAREAFREVFGSVRAFRPPLSHNEVLVGTPEADGLRNPRHVRALGSRLSNPRDQRRWKELRNLKLR